MSADHGASRAYAHKRLIGAFDVPVWFDEGAAMQVDYREKYNLDGKESISFDGNALRSARQFFKGDDAELTRHYALAKHEVRQWLEKVGYDGFFILLDRIKQGDDFNSSYKASCEEK